MSSAQKNDSSCFKIIIITTTISKVTANVKQFLPSNTLLLCHILTIHIFEPLI